MMKKVLVLGGSGFIGAHVCEKLVRAGYRVSVATRKAEHAKPVMHLPGLTVLVCNVHDEAALTHAAAGMDAVVNLVAILHGSLAAFSHVHQELPAKIARACRAQAVRHLVHISALGVNTDNPQALPSHYLRSKALGELALMDGLGLRRPGATADATSLTVLRPSVVFGVNDKFLNVFAALQAHFPVMPLACADALFQPVWVEDVAQAVVQCVGQGLDGVAPSRIFELAGPQVLSLRDLVQFAARCAGIRQGRGRPVVGLPLWMGRVQAALLGLLPGAPLMSADNLASMQLPNVLDGRLPGLGAMGITPTPLETIGPQYLVADPANAGFDGLRQRHR